MPKALRLFQCLDANPPASEDEDKMRRAGGVDDLDLPSQGPNFR